MSRVASGLASAMLLVAAPVWAGQASGTAPRAETPLRLWYDHPAPDDDDGWVSESLPTGNGYMGVNVFGGVARERLQITENSLVDSPSGSIGGLNSFADVWLEFPHAAPSGYSRDLNLNDGTSHVSYDNAGVRFTRDYFASYPDNVLVVRLRGAKPGSLDFTLKPRIPYLVDHRTAQGDHRGKHGTVTAAGDTVTLRGVMDYYGVKFEGQFKVIPQGGTMRASNGVDGGDGSISVKGATSAVILIAVGTNYPIGNPRVFSEMEPGRKLADLPDPHARVTGTIAAAAKRGYDDLLARHEADYRALYSRSAFDLGAAVPNETTDRLIDGVRAGATSPYLEELAFQFGRYMLISSSRKGALPPNLQGVWNVYQDAPWTAGYWHNVNEQMNYWPAFNTNMPGLFDSYVDLYRAYLPAQRTLATAYLKQYHPSGLAADGDDGWALGNSMRPFERSVKTAHSGFGTGPWTTMLFWDDYDFTRDLEVLRRTVYPAMRGQANFLSRFIQDFDGKLLAKPSSSPENAGSLQTIGATFDQQMIYENYRDTISAASILKLDDPLIGTLKAQIGRLDPILIGDSGQIKEYREETTYGSIGDPKHRHVSQLLGLYPGRLINSTTPAWLDAAKVSLEGRGLVGGTGWSQAERVATWARAGDAETAYGFYRYWLSHHAMHNLWNNHRDSLKTKLFQADGNFGVTAGVGEMLLQSNDGTVAPLPALPKAWASGSYRGLLARGAFEVSASWSNGHADALRIVSKTGGVLKLRYPGVSRADIKDADGKRVAFERIDDDIVAINTKAGQGYAVTAIPFVTRIAAVSGLAISADAGDAVRLDWKPVAGAKTYSVDRAIGDAPTYDQIASGLTGASFTDLAPAIGTARHVRYRVTAVGADGREGTSASVFRLRPDAGEARAFRIDDHLFAYDAGSGDMPQTITADGRYLVRMKWLGGSLTEVAVTAKTAGTARISSPMLQRPVRVVGPRRQTISAPLSVGGLTLPMKAGETYRIISEAVITASVPRNSILENGTIPVSVVLRAEQSALSASDVTLGIPAGWRVEPTRVRLPSVGQGRAATARFDVSAPSTVADGTYAISAQVESSGWKGSTPLKIVVRIPDLALGGAATQSSEALGGVAARAVDGKTLGQIEAGSVSSTGVEKRPWWQVDLGAPRPIGAIVVWNRTDDCCKAALSDYYVLVSDTPITAGTLDEALALPRIWSSHGSVAPAPSKRFEADRNGRYVRIWSARTQELDLAEVQVFPKF